MAVNTLLVKSYATNVYLTGGNSLTNIGATRPEYVQPVMQYCADKYYINNVDTALALKGPEDPQYWTELQMIENGITV